MQERLDITVETHLWRRQIVVVKRFRFDFLTRDNIKYFKREANIFKVLKHEHVVRFFGIMVDPPSLGIVMQFAPNGDLFQKLENKRKDYIKGLENGTINIKNNNKRGSISINKNFYNEDRLSDTLSNEDGIQTNSTDTAQSRHFDRERVLSENSDDDRKSHSDRSTIGWSDKSRGLGSRIALRISTVAGNKIPLHTCVVASGNTTFDPLVCAHQV